MKKLLFIFILYFMTNPAIMADEAKLTSNPVSISNDDYDDLDFLDDDDGDELSEVTTIKAPALRDPLKFINKPIFKLNLLFYKYLGKPLAQGWQIVVPKSARTGLNNAFRNLGYPLRASACVLQWRWHDAGSETIRFVANTSGGLLGFRDIAAKGSNGIQPVFEDFGQAMGSWGLGHGFYIVLPLLGPSSLRDGIGWYGGTFVHPYFFVDDWLVTLALGGTDKLNKLSFQYKDIDIALEGSLDPYAAAKDFYNQSRQKEIEE